MKATLAIRTLHNRGVVDVGEGFADGFGTISSGEWVAWNANVCVCWQPSTMPP